MNEFYVGDKITVKYAISLFKRGGGWYPLGSEDGDMINLYSKYIYESMCNQCLSPITMYSIQHYVIKVCQ